MRGHDAIGCIRRFVCAAAHRCQRRVRRTHGVWRARIDGFAEPSERPFAPRRIGECATTMLGRHGQRFGGQWFLARPHRGRHPIGELSDGDGAGAGGRQSAGLSQCSVHRGRGVLGFVDLQPPLRPEAERGQGVLHRAAAVPVEQHPAERRGVRACSGGPPQLHPVLGAGERNVEQPQVVALGLCCGTALARRLILGGGLVVGIEQAVVPAHRGRNVDGAETMLGERVGSCGGLAALEAERHEHDGVLEALG